jgi:carbon-monoxide dehydrogenase medium subunit
MLGVFEIHEPATLQEASQILAAYDSEATVYAGGTELLVLMKEGLVHYPHLVNIKTIPGLAEVVVDEAQRVLRLGALTTHRQLEQSPVVKQNAPLLAEVEARVANIRVRSAGTLGGNLCFAEPHSDPGTLLLAWGASLQLSSAGARRTVPIETFFVGMLETSRRPDEILSEIRLPLFEEGTAGAYEKFSTHERPTANVAVIIRVRDGVIETARIAVGSVGPLPIRIGQAESILQGEAPGPDVFNAAAESAALAVDPIEDIYGAVDYKRHLVRVLTRRALTTAAERIRPEVNG